MDEQDNTKEQLLAELAALRQRVAALQESEERYRTLVEVVPQLMGWADANRETVDCNHRWYEYTGQTPEEARGLGWMKALHPGDVPRVMQRVSDTRATGEPYEVQYRLRRASDGAYRWHLARSMPTKDKDARITGWFVSATDIDDQKQAEAALRESEERFRKVFEEGPIGILLVGTDGRLQHANRRFCEMLGYSESAIIAVGLAGISHPDDWERDHPFVSRLWRGEISHYHVEKRYLRKDGQAVWGQLTISLMHDEAGRPINTIGMIEDITERKQAEEALQRAHDELEEKVKERTVELTKANEELVLFRKFADTASQGFGMGDLESRMAYVNPAMCRLMGEEKPEDVIGKHSLAYFPEEWEPRRASEVIPALERAGHWEGEQSMLSRQGQLTPTLQHAFLLRDEQGKPFRLAVVVTDITERKRAEEALQQSEEKYRGLVEASPDSVVMSDLRGHVLFASGQTWSLLGLADSDELIGHSVFDYVIESDRGRLAANLAQLLQAGVRKNTEYTAVRKDGTTVPNETSSAVIRDAAGKPKAVMAVIRDITERKKAEEALERERRTLQHLLRASDHERQLIAYDIHDGLAQQLAGAIMQFQICEYQKDTKPQDAQKAFAGGIALLRQSHAEARRLISGVRPPILDESGVMAAIAHLVHDPAFDQGPEIDFRSRVTFHRLAPVLENVIYRIVQEGLANARNHSRSEKVLVSLVQRGNRICIEIRDWGVGFDPKTAQENSFGLKGIRERARLLGGTCNIKSKTGKGTSILVELPAVEQEVGEY
jgi:PAS domain S-box-containing protein